MLRIGRISYTNCTPIFYALNQLMKPKLCQYIDGVPSELNSMLRKGTIDICPSSSFEYALNPERYVLLPNIAISSMGAVQSVLLFSKIPIEKLHNSTISVTCESATSVALLKIIMKQRYACDCSYTLTTETTLTQTTENPILLIGDNALKASLKSFSGFCYDLGKLWYEWTDTPFVFALWICSADAVKSHWHELCFLNETLQEIKKTIADKYEEIADNSLETAWIDRASLLDYWRNAISYDLCQPQLHGLQLFYEKALDMGFIAKKPTLKFLPVEIPTNSN